MDQSAAVLQILGRGLWPLAMGLGRGGPNHRTVFSLSLEPEIKVGVLLVGLVLWWWGGLWGEPAPGLSHWLVDGPACTCVSSHDLFSRHLCVQIPLLYKDTS